MKDRSKANGKDKGETSSSGIIRNGQRHPFKKVSLMSVEERVLWVEHLMRTRPMLKGQLKDLIKREFRVEWRMAEIYITRARERLLQRLDQVKREHRADSLAFYEGVISGEEAGPGEKIRARERIDKLLGLEAPMQIAHSGEIANPSTVEIKDLKLDLDTRRRLLLAVRLAKMKNGNGDDTTAQQSEVE